MPFITFNGDLLWRFGGLAFTKACCCVGVYCYCLSRTQNYQVVERTVVCYLAPYYNPTLGYVVYPDGHPGDAASFCPPGTAGYYITFEGNMPRVAGCGGQQGGGYDYSLIVQPNQCTTIAPPP